MVHCVPQFATETVSLHSAESRRKERERKRNYRKTAGGRIERLLSNARVRAKQKGIPCELSTKMLRIPERCPVLDVPLILNGPLPNRPTIDRIENDKGYVEGNVAIISFRANSIKHDATIDELRAVLAYMEAHELLS